MSELKRCPFCGGEGMLLPQHYHCAIECFGCGIITRVYKNECLAVQAWNTRTNINENLAENYERMLEFIQNHADSSHEGCIKARKLLKEMGMTDE